MNNRNDIDTHPTPPAKLASIKNKGNALCSGHENSTLVLQTCLPGVRRLPNLAPKPATVTTNSESHHIFGGDFQRKRPRVSDDTQGSPQLSQHIYATMEPMSLANDAGSHMGNSILGFIGSVGGSSIQSMTNGTQRSENHTPATPFDPSPNSHNLSQREISWPYTLANIPDGYIPQPPSMMLQGPPISDPLGGAPVPALRICAGCDARLTGFRNFIYTEVQDTALKMRLLGEYFALRDNWHSCHTRGF